MDKDFYEKFDLNLFGYTIIKLAYLSEDYQQGLAKSLYYAKICMNADNIVIFKNDGIDGEYSHKYNQALMKGNSERLTELLNSTIGEEDGEVPYKVETELGDSKSVIFVPITIRDSKYVIAVTSKDKDFNIRPDILIKFREAMTIVMEKVKTVNDLIRDSIYCKLTHLRNRNSYEENISSIRNTNGMVFGLFDLFRLKTVNDQYGHDKGDEYIVRTAEILDKYFPEFVIRSDENGKKQQVYTGTRLYRIGGDEFVLITNDSLESVELRAQQAMEEVRNMNLGIPDEIGMNSGIVQSVGNESIKELTNRADELLKADKTATYKRLGIERRQGK